MVADAITGKGVETATDATFEIITDNIGQIRTLSETSDATAVATDILSGKTAYVKSELVIGTMNDHSGCLGSANNVTENEDGTTVEIGIPGGYYDEDSKITIPIDTVEKLPTINNKITYDVIIDAINNKRNGLNRNAKKEEIAAYITTHWTGGSSNGKIQYQYHYHSNSCYYICGGEQTIKSNSDNYSYTIRCTKCGASRTTNNGTHPGICTRKFYTCGKNDGEIIGATIVF